MPVEPKKKRKKRRFTLIELLMVIAIIGILTSFMLPALSSARASARLARWRGYKNNLRGDSRLLLYFDFENTGEKKLINKSAYLEGSSSYDPKSLDGTWKDVEAPQWTNTGRWPGKGACYFNGKSKITIPDSKLFEGIDEFSLETWINPYTDSGQHGIATKWTGGTGGLFLLRLWHGNRASFFIQSSSKAYSSATSSVRIQKNTWTHIVGVYDGKTIKIYVNGKLSGTKKWEEGPPPRGITDMVIGEDRNGVCSFVGKIDELGIFRRALSASEIKQHYDMGHP